MSLINGLLEMEPLGTAFFGSVFLVLLLIPILIIYVSIAAPFFSKRYDSILFNDKHFTITELGFYTTWPFNLMKVMVYMALIAAPGYMRKRKRFRNFDVVLDVPRTYRIASITYITLHLLTFSIGLVFFGVGGYVYLFR